MELENRKGIGYRRFAVIMLYVVLVSAVTLIVPFNLLSSVFWFSADRNGGALFLAILILVDLLLTSIVLAPGMLLFRIKAYLASVVASSVAIVLVLAALLSAGLNKEFIESFCIFPWQKC